MWQKKIAAMMTVLSICGVMAVQGADYTILEKTERVETTVYGTPQTGALQARAAALDSVLNGTGRGHAGLQEEIDAMYKDVYGNAGDYLSLLSTVNLLQGKYARVITDEPLTVRVENLEEGILGHAGSGPLTTRVAVLRRLLLGNKRYVAQGIPLPVGTVIPVKLLDALDSRTAQTGDIVRFAVLQPIKIGDMEVIPEGMTLDGTVTKVRKAKRFGVDGKITLQFHQLRAIDGTLINVKEADRNTEEYKHAVGAAGASAAGALVLGPIGLVGGLFVHGNEAVIPTGTVMYVQTVRTVETMGIKRDGIIDRMQSADLVAGSINTDAILPVPLPVAPLQVPVTPKKAAVQTDTMSTAPVTTPVQPSVSDISTNGTEPVANVAVLAPAPVPAVATAAVRGAGLPAVPQEGQKPSFSSGRVPVPAAATAGSGREAVTVNTAVQDPYTKPLTPKKNDIQEKQPVSTSKKQVVSGNDDEIVVTIQPTRKDSNHVQKK